MKKSEVAKEKKLVVEMERKGNTLSVAERQELLRLKCRTDFVTYARYITKEVPIAGTFKPFPVHFVIGSFMQRIGDGDPTFKRSVISLPPRTGKSMLISKIFPSWQMGRSPTAQFMMSSYGLQLTNENARAVIAYISSKAFKWIFPECQVDPKDSNLNAIRNKHGGLIKVASAKTDVTGFGYGVIDDDELPGIGLLDDLLADGNSPQIMESTFNWTQTQFLTRGLPNNAVISMGTRFNVDDVIGRLIKADPEGWRELNVPALCVDEETDLLQRKLGESHWPEFFPVETISALRKSIGERDFQALYQGSPAGSQGSIFKEHWFSTHEKNRSSYSYIYATIDTAYKAETQNDFTAVCVWGALANEQKLHLVHYVLDRLEFPDLEKMLPELIKNWKIRSVYIEGRAAGMPLIQTLRRKTNISVKELVPNKDKVLRANSVAPLVESGYVSLYENIPNFAERMSELTSFPYIKNDDFVDAFVYGVGVYRDEMQGSKVLTGGARAALPKLVYGGYAEATRKTSSLALKDRPGKSFRNATRYL